MKLLKTLSEAIRLIKEALQTGMTIYLTDEHIQISRGGYEPRTETIQINSKIHKALRERFNL